jgi:hypothetical protein
MIMNFKLSDIKVGNKATIGNVEVGIQYKPGELVGEYKLFRQIVKELPEVFADLADGCMAVDSLDKAFDKVADANIAGDPESKVSAVNNVLNAVSNIRQKFTGKTEDNNIEEEAI